MFCKHCGKEISEEAFMCPNCGTPTGNKAAVNKPADRKDVPFGTIALVLACIAFVTGVTFGVFTYIRSYWRDLLVTIICFITVLPSLTAMCLGITTFYQKNATWPSRIMAIVAIAIAFIVVLFLFLTACILFA